MCLHLLFHPATPVHVLPSEALGVVALIYAAFLFLEEMQTAAELETNSAGQNVSSGKVGKVFIFNFGH